MKALNDPGLRAKFDAAGQDAVASTPEQFAAKIQGELALVGKIVKAAGIKPE